MKTSRHASVFNEVWRGACLLTVVSLIGSILVAPPTWAALGRGDFPRATFVKESMTGKGDWDRHVWADSAPLGATPAKCRSDLPLAQAREDLAAVYNGPVRGTNAYQGTVQVTVAEFRTRAAAARALRGLADWVRACPTSKEWFCDQCDVLYTAERRPARHRRVGTQTVTWNERRHGMGVTNGRHLATRTGRTVVLVYAAHFTSPEILTTPPPPKWRSAVSIAQRTLARAT